MSTSVGLSTGVKYACIPIEYVTTTLYAITRIDAIKVELKGRLIGQHIGKRL
jgi:hypothetical protein